MERKQSELTKLYTTTTMQILHVMQFKLMQFQTQIKLFNFSRSYQSISNVLEISNNKALKL